MRRMRSALAVLVLGSGTLVGGALAAAPASAASCGWRVVETAQVRETPSINSVVRKTKYPGEIVTGPQPFCFPITGTDDRKRDPVYCSCATDGIGYILDSKLYQLDNV